jgi:hypothetical protein
MPWTICAHKKGETMSETRERLAAIIREVERIFARHPKNASLAAALQSLRAAKDYWDNRGRMQKEKP